MIARYAKMLDDKYNVTPPRSANINEHYNVTLAETLEWIFLVHEWGGLYTKISFSHTIISITL